jgi:anti-sigma B factor antagonist
VTHPAAHDAGLSLTASTEHGYVIATLGGELDIASAPTLREQLIGLLRPAASRLIIDLSAVGYADASGLAVLVGTGRRAGLLGGCLRLAAPSPEVARVLAATGINQHLDIFPTVQAAITGQRPHRGTAETPGPASPHARHAPSPHMRPRPRPQALSCPSPPGSPSPAPPAVTAASAVFAVSSTLM